VTTTLSRRRKVILAVWCAFSALVVFVMLTPMAGWINAMSVMLAIACLASVAALIANPGSVKATQEQAFLDTYGSLDGARAALDLDALRAVRDTEGVIPAVRRVRREHPAIPLAQAAEIVRGL
jgi:hypothetical protein